eukprot:COSAG05_NODE_2908_length_2519_cov_1.604545_2_plen_101_part_00
MSQSARILCMRTFPSMRMGSSGTTLLCRQHNRFHEESFGVMLHRYPLSVLAGDNLSFPKRGACNETQKLGDNGCASNPFNLRPPHHSLPASLLTEPRAGS